MTNIVIVDLGAGNLFSVKQAAKFVAPDRSVLVSNDPEIIRGAEHLILPGQGAIGTWMEQFTRNRALNEALVARLDNGPVLGICVGLQALFSHSDENDGVPCLNRLPGKVLKFSASDRDGSLSESSARFKVPHMGWNTVEQTADHPLWADIKDHEYFYFVHSYYVAADDSSHVSGTCDYGVNFCAAASDKNIFASQFHPEKSHRAGLQLLKNFIHWDGIAD